MRPVQEEHATTDKFSSSRKLASYPNKSQQCRCGSLAKRWDLAVGFTVQDFLTLVRISTSSFSTIYELG